MTNAPNPMATSDHRFRPSRVAQSEIVTLRPDFCPCYEFRQEVKPLHIGQSARNGLHAILLAEAATTRTRRRSVGRAVAEVLRLQQTLSRQARLPAPIRAAQDAGEGGEHAGYYPAAHTSRGAWEGPARTQLCSKADGRRARGGEHLAGDELRALRAQWNNASSTSPSPQGGRT